MTNPVAGSRKLCVAYDVAGYSRLSARSQLATQSRLAHMLDLAFGGAGLPGRKYEIQDQGDGGVAILTLDAGTDEPRLIASFIRAMEVGLTELNKNLIPAAQIRLRVSMAEGIIRHAATGFTGTVVIEACRLRDSDVLRRALAETEAHLAVALTDALYRDTHDHLAGYLDFERAEFSLKGMSGTAWIYLTPNPARQVRLHDLLATAEGYLSHPLMDHGHESRSHAAETHDPGVHTGHEDHQHAHDDSHHSDPDLW